MSRRRDPGDLSPREAVQRFVRDRKPDSTDQSITAYEGRLKHWIEWCQAVGIDRVGDLSGWDFDEYKTARAGEGVQNITLYGEFHTLNQLAKYLASIDAIDEDLPEKIQEQIPRVSRDERSSDVKLASGDAIPQLKHYRSSSDRASLYHVVLEIAWFTGARRSGLRSLDVRDFYPEECYLDFVHRPHTGTTLKLGEDGERPVGIPQEVADIIQEYIDEHRWERHDEYGRQPLLASMQGRPQVTTITAWCYQATLPCIRTDCPHGKDPETCAFTSYNEASKCPSSRASHHIRTGSITWQRDLGFPPEVVAERVNASLRTIEDYYDKASKREKLERRRRPWIHQMDLDADLEDTDSSENTDT